MILLVYLVYKDSIIHQYPSNIPAHTGIIKMKLFIFLLAALASLTYGFEDTDLHGIAYTQMTVENIDLSLRFYTEIFDGMLIPEFRVRALQDDETYQKMFQKEILEAQELGVDPETLGVPNISVGK